MTKGEFQRLLGFYKAKQNAPFTSNIGRRQAKGAGKGYGFVGKGSRVIPQVGLERHFGNSVKPA